MCAKQRDVPSTFDEVLLDELGRIKSRREEEEAGGDPPWKNDLEQAKEIKNKRETRQGEGPSRKEEAEEEAQRQDLLRKARAHARDMHLTGLTFSGGGIRSATFCLGILQGLANLGLLKRFDYLSTVSGGGYIGSW